MKKLLRRLSKVADLSSPSTHYSLLRSSATSPSENSKTPSFRVPCGHLPVYVGEEMERFIVSAELLNHPVFVELLDRSAQEYGYEQKGVLRIPCHVALFERVLETLRVGGEARHLLLCSSPDKD